MKRAQTEAMKSAIVCKRCGKSAAVEFIKAIDMKNRREKWRRLHGSPFYLNVMPEASRETSSYYLSTFTRTFSRTTCIRDGSDPRNYDHRWQITPQECQPSLHDLNYLLQRIYFTFSQNRILKSRDPSFQYNRSHSIHVH